MRERAVFRLQLVIIRLMRNKLWCQLSTWPDRKDPVYRARQYRYLTQRGRTWLP